MASLTMYSRKTGPSAARPSPRRENAVPADDLAEQDGPPVAELLYEGAELMAGVSQRDRIGAFRDDVAGEDLCSLGRLERDAVGTEGVGEGAVHFHDTRVANGRRRDARVEALRQASVCVLEAKHRHRSLTSARPRPQLGVFNLTTAEASSFR
jgi:hypothetical protein